MRQNMLVHAPGFSLIELLISITIIGIILAYALPALQAHLLTARRIEAINLLYDAASHQARFRLQNHRYASFAELTASPPAGPGMATRNRYYRLSLTLTAGNAGYVAQATVEPGAAQARDQKCWSFTLDNVNRRTASNKAADDNTRACWRQD